ncbi:MAG: metallophosphoesterase [Alphaproteobacteria bacterium]
MMNDAAAGTGTNLNRDRDPRPEARRRAWLEQRQALENARRKITLEGPVGFRRRARLDFALTWFERLLRLSGWHGRGRANALNITLKPLALTLQTLPREFDGYRILQISDPHLDRLPELAERIAALVRAVPVDVLILTGDYRDRHRDPPEPGLALLKPILDAVDPKDGRFALLGNHDPAAAAAILEAMGLTVLLNQTVTLERGGAALHLTGLDDVHSFFTEAARDALEEVHEGCRIAAVHSPEAADVAAKAGIDLYLCGHTHGGQICLPGGRPLLTQLHRCRAYSRGLWRHDAMIGYTSLGAGVVSMPIRFNCPPEVVLITLHAPAPD